ncbi:MAG: cytochrome c oxidase subunit 3 [Chthonomonas sp.]|nr:cytochrome c oxidase subunit 3 [Chthonomonas sp.]
MAISLNKMNQPQDVVYEQFEDLAQQQETYVIGMWAFLVTEVMFFGVMFMSYVVYRWKYQPYFYALHQELDWRIGGINTFILLLSSFSVALAVHFHQKKKKMQTLACLGFTNLCALAFLVIKMLFEYIPKWNHGHYPGPGFTWDNPNIPGNIAQLWYSLYFGTTGLHGLHVLIGIILFSVLMFMIAVDHPAITDYLPTEMLGLYWHFVDIVWIFLYPLYYLMPK